MKGLDFEFFPREVAYKNKKKGIIKAIGERKAILS
jgi:hypothetical protein